MGIQVLNPLIGLLIHKVELNQSKTIICFYTNNGKFTYLCSADCCSESWIEHISGIENLLGRIIQSIDEHDEVSLMGTRQLCDKIYGFTLHCRWPDRNWSNECKIEYRNSSNGYYGGSLDLLTHEKYKHLLETEEIEIEEFKEVKEDF